MARRCDDTVDKKRANSCVLKQIFLEGVEQPKISPKNPGNAFSDALLKSRFQNFAADAACAGEPAQRRVPPCWHAGSQKAHQQSAPREHGQPAGCGPCELEDARQHDRGGIETGRHGQPHRHTEFHAHGAVKPHHAHQKKISTPHGFN